MGWMRRGAGAPGVGQDFAREADLASSPDFLVAPSGPLTLQDIRLTTHQVTVRIPF